ncbi:amine oxidase, flavin-containing [Nitrospirillum viridazoti Y2]|uniref:Tryptophan 2-monooxygenase n=2 Tax=Nitrospirillum TaxID=1543705 RepID=A0A560HJ43_9PROT|nr:amine oxidase, flavin-containing [Nitrospirillum amazonense Y2]TWB46508.1 monoamine oxidase [Nitrospirillum amazonense]
MGFRDMKRRDLLSLIGTVAGSAVMYQAATSLGLAAETTYKGPIKLDGDAKGASILILGAGVAGLVAAIELRKAGYKVQVLEYREKAGGRSWSLRGGDTYTELGGFKQTVGFDTGLYINPGPWRIPYHHRAVLDYCHRYGVALEPFNQVNYNAYLHSAKAYGGKPQRFREIQADYHGHVAELLAKLTHQNALDGTVTKEDQEKLLESLRAWGGLDKNYAYAASLDSSNVRGYEKAPGGGVNGAPVPSTPASLSDVMRGGLWRFLGMGLRDEFQSTIFQPVGGMDQFPAALARQVKDLIRFNTKVTEIHQDDHGVTVTYTDTVKGGAPQTAKADWCLCTIPLSVLSQIKLNVGPKMANAISAVPYEAAAKVGLQFKRRFWEQDEAIYGGISFTDLPIAMIGYPNSGYGSPGKGVLLGTYVFGAYAMEYTAMPPEERIKRALAYGAQIHPQYTKEFDTGVAVGWHRVPWTLGCHASWTEETRAAHYQDLCQVDGRIALAGEHASYITGWQEGAVLSSLDAITRLHQRVVTA